MKSDCATLIVLNKWDLFEGDEADLDHERARAHQQAAPAPQGDDRQCVRAAATSRGCCPR